MSKLWSRPGGKALSLALVAFAAAAAFAMWNVNNQWGTDCGSWLSANNTLASQADAATNSDRTRRQLDDALLESAGDLSALPKPTGTYGAGLTQVEACRQARQSRQPTVLTFGALAVALFAVGAMQRLTPRSAP